MTEERKIVQIAFKPDVIDSTHYVDTYALADDGTVWVMEWVDGGPAWRLAKWPELPRKGEFV